MLGILGLWGVVDGHTMKQVRAVISSDGASWDATVWFEAWALYPDHGPALGDGVPGHPDRWGTVWVSTLNAADHAQMRDFGEEYVRDCFVLNLAEERMDFDCSFPDYQGGETPELVENGDGNALIRIDLKGRFPDGAEGPLELVWQDEFLHPLAVQVRLAKTGEKLRTRLMRIAANEDPVELMVLEASGEVAEGEESSLWSWIVAGFEHILPKGLDHILFILGLFLLQPKARPLLWQTSAFTVAHSMTLALVVLGFLTVPAKFVESMIALSIAYVGIENLWVKELKPWRVSVVFALGLLHGMGFASVMKELRLPEGEVLKPLLAFNLGVEAGQVTVLGLAFLICFLFLKKEGFQVFRKGASALIAVTGLYWAVERLMG
ncbi:HupE/UreJ family protein [Haloferula chungangensis]|uniref:HupE/UreJ family protein n=1 Tax=Haloferula chungangensis TaxID=1048331 RepID=A0ABW2LBR9_9BACT